MPKFLDAILSFPGAALTVLLLAVVIYWLFVLVSGIDLDGSGEAHGDVHGDAQGDAHGDDLGDAHGDDLGDAHGHHTFGETVPHVLEILGAVSLRRVPLTVRVSLVAIFSWLVCVLGWLALAPLLPRTALSALMTAASLGIGLRLAGWAARPMVPLFTPKRAPSQSDLGGRDGEVVTGRVDGSFGQVLVHDGGAGLLVEARYEGAAPLTKGTRVVVTWWDTDHRCARVEPLDASPGPRIEAVTDARDDDVGGASSGERPATRRGGRPR